MIPQLVIENLTDEQILKEFVKRFKVDGAMLLYIEGGQESGFFRWRNKEGRKWVSNLTKLIKSRY